MGMSGGVGSGTVKGIHGETYHSRRTYGGIITTGAMVLALGGGIVGGALWGAKRGQELGLYQGTTTQMTISCNSNERELNGDNMQDVIGQLRGGGQVVYTGNQALDFCKLSKGHSMTFTNLNPTPKPEWYERMQNLPLADRFRTEDPEIR